MGTWGQDRGTGDMVAMTPAMAPPQCPWCWGDTSALSLWGWHCWCPQGGGGTVSVPRVVSLSPSLSPQEPSLYTVKAVIILDNDGERLFAKVGTLGTGGDTQGTQRGPCPAGGYGSGEGTGWVARV